MSLMLLLLPLCAGPIQRSPTDVPRHTQPTPTQDGSAHRTTRRQAVIDYLLALYKPEEGTFYWDLEDWPTDPRICHYPTIFNVYYPYCAFECLNYTRDFDWTNVTSFMLGLINDESNYDVFGPLNKSRVLCPSVYDYAFAVELYLKLGVVSELDVDAIVDHIRQLQTSSGGFLAYPDDEGTPFLADTFGALRTLSLLNRTDDIDTSAALNYVISCYRGDGFSRFPYYYTVDYVSTVRGLLSLTYLGALDRISRSQVTAFISSRFENDTGCLEDGGLQNTHWAIWALTLVHGLDEINRTAVAEYVLECQSTWHGAFMNDPDDDPIYGEDIELAWEAVHTLQLMGCLDSLDREVSLVMYPQYKVPRAYYDYISRNFPSTTTAEDFWARFGQNLVENLGRIIFTIVVATPCIYWCGEKGRARRAKRAAEKATYGQSSIAVDRHAMSQSTERGHAK